MQEALRKNGEGGAVPHGGRLGAGAQIEAPRLPGTALATFERTLPQHRRQLPGAAPSEAAGAGGGEVELGL